MGASGFRLEKLNIFEFFCFCFLWFHPGQRYKTMRSYIFDSAARHKTPWSLSFWLASCTKCRLQTNDCSCCLAGLRFQKLRTLFFVTLEININTERDVYRVCTFPRLPRPLKQRLTYFCCVNPLGKQVGCSVKDLKNSWFGWNPRAFTYAQRAQRHSSSKAIGQFLTAWAWQTCLMWASSNQALRWQLLFLKSVLSLAAWHQGTASLQALCRFLEEHQKRKKQRR